MHNTHDKRKATLAYILKLANMGWKDALKQDVHFLAGLTVHAGNVTNKHVAQALDYQYLMPPKAAVNDVVA